MRMMLLGPCRIVQNFIFASVKQKCFIHSTKILSSKQHHLIELSEEAVCPQGIQGANDANLSLWWETCNRYGLENCQSQLEGIQSGRKTLSQVLVEQDALIQQIADSYKNEHVQKTENIQGVQDMNYLRNIDAPCPQGVQGDECAQFKIWLKNCHRFGFQNCLDQAESTKIGRQNLSGIFREQERMIRSVVQQYQQRRDYTTSKPSGQVSNTEPVKKLGSKERLKQAVKDYGATVIVFHVGISLISLGGFYLAVSSGIDMVGLLKWIGLDSKIVTGTSTFVVAYAVHKVFMPVRIGITLTCTPFIVHYLRRVGVLKTPKINKS